MFRIDLIREFKRGIIYNAIGQYSNMFIQILINSILSRILFPEDFGIVAIVNVFLIFFTMLSDMGIGPAIIQNKELEKNDLESLFKFTLYLGVLLSVSFAFMGVPISIFYNDERFRRICLLLGVNVFFSSLIIVPQAYLMKQKKFKETNSIIVIANIISGVFAIVLALLGYSYFSLIFSSIIKVIVQFILLEYKAKLRFNMKVDILILNKIYHFSKNQFLFNFINYFSRNLDNILVGKYIGAKDLAFYSKAYQLSLYPNQILSGVLNNAIQPILKDYEKQSDVLWTSYKKITEIMATIGIPLSIFLFFSSEEVILIMFGNQWELSVLPFKILACSVWAQMINSSLGGILQSANRTDLLLKSGLISTMVNVLAIVIGVYTRNINLVALCILISFTINLFQANYIVTCLLFRKKFQMFLSILTKPLLIGIVEIVIIIVLSLINMNIWILFFLKILTFIFIVIFGLYINGVLKYIFKQKG